MILPVGDITYPYNGKRNCASIKVTEAIFAAASETTVSRSDNSGLPSLFPGKTNRKMIPIPHKTHNSTDSMAGPPLYGQDTLCRSADVTDRIDVSTGQIKGISLALHFFLGRKTILPSSHWSSPLY
jgi:hypothetical protein